MDMEEILESPGFWILSAIGISAEVLGYVWSRNQEMMTMPIWQLIVLMVVTIAASAFFATKE